MQPYYNEEAEARFSSFLSPLHSSSAAAAFLLSLLWTSRLYSPDFAAIVVPSWIPVRLGFLLRRDKKREELKTPKWKS